MVSKNPRTIQNYSTLRAHSWLPACFPKSLPFQGIGLSTPAGTDGLNVTVGTAMCVVTEVTDQYIVCDLPEEEPNPMGNLHVVYVQISDFLLHFCLCFVLETKASHF